MNWQKAFGRINEVGSNLVIAATQFLSRRHWVRTPSHAVDAVGQGEHTYRIDRTWCKATPRDLPIKNAHEMVIDSKDRLYLLTDHPRNNIIVFNLDGSVANSWTLASTGAHGLTLTKRGGVDSLWICDPYAAKVIETSLDGQILRTLPDPHALGIYSSMMPYAPTQTAVAPNGDIYVADGYGSQWVMQFDAAGKYVRHFGGKANGPAQLDFAHGLAIDDRNGPGSESVLVTSRRQSCIKRFSLSGDYLGEIALPGGYPCRPVLHGDKLLVSLCWSGAHLRPNTGFIVILDKDNRPCATLGGHAACDDEGRLKNLATDYTCFHHVHDVCADRSGNLYVCQWNAGNVYPLKLELI